MVAPTTESSNTPINTNLLIEICKKTGAAQSAAPADLGDYEFSIESKDSRARNKREMHQMPARATTV